MVKYGILYLITTHRHSLLTHTYTPFAVFLKFCCNLFRAYNMIVCYICMLSVPVVKKINRSTPKHSFTGQVC